MDNLNPQQSSNAPVDISVGAFIEARAAELESMYVASSKVHGNARIMQNLPRHMRRRAASHNIKRLPRRIRRTAQKETINNQPNKTKRPSRCHRRRPRNLLSEYQRRQRCHMWLETHIWHAKRFHMTTQWGYKLPNFPNDKGYRACHRAMKEYCIMWDMSYLCCIEISGKEEDIIAPMKRLFNQETGPTPSSKSVLGGTREGNNVMYCHDSYPYHAIGPVGFIWRPSLDSKRQLWLWVHPTIYDTILNELAVVYDAVQREGEIKMDEDDTAKNDSRKEAVTKENPEYHSCKITLKSLKDSLCRYRLLGPKSQSIILEGLQPANQKLADFCNNKMECEEMSDLWWKSYGVTELNQFVGGLDEIKKEWDPSQIQPSTVHGLIVRDPRLFVPSKITIATEQIKECAQMTTEWQSVWSDSFLWDTNTRLKVKLTKMTEHQLNEKKSECLVPGSLPNLGKDESLIPLLLIHQPSMTQGSGWDIILPAGWGMSFWIALVYRGARVGGLQQLQQINRTLQKPYFVNDYPDTAACKEWMEMKAKEDEKEYLKRPPAKRVNYQKLGTAHHAFSLPWTNLIGSKFYVLRSKNKLIQIIDAVKNNQFDCLDGDSLCDSLIPVTVSAVRKGVPSPRTMIALPLQEDLINLDKDISYQGPVEPIHNEKDYQCIRTTIGYFTEGNACLSVGKGKGFGFITYTGLIQVVKAQTSKDIKVLGRGLNDTIYRFYNMEILY